MCYLVYARLGVLLDPFPLEPDCSCSPFLQEVTHLTGCIGELIQLIPQCFQPQSLSILASLITSRTAAVAKARRCISCGVEKRGNRSPNLGSSKEVQALWRGITSASAMIHNCSRTVRYWLVMWIQKHAMQNYSASSMDASFGCDMSVRILVSLMFSQKSNILLYASG